MARQAHTVASSASYFSARRRRDGPGNVPRKRAPRSTASATGSGSTGGIEPARRAIPLPASELPGCAEDWHLDCEYRGHSSATLATRHGFLKSLGWFLKHRNYSTCGEAELKEFFHYLRHGHEEPGGRWGKDQYFQPVRPQTTKDYWICFSTFFKWLVAENVVAVSPLAKIPKPVVRSEEKQSLTPAQVKALLSAAKRSLHPRRDEAVVLLLLDTGIRSSELCGLKVKDIDLHARQCAVLGKGNKVRVVHFGVTTGNALRQHLRQLRQGLVRHGQFGDDLLSADPSANRPHNAEVERLGPELPLFVADKSGPFIRAISRSGLQQLLERLARDAGIECSCSPHVLRRTFAVTWLRNGANVFSLQAMLGHTDLRMTQRYLSLARADIAEQARQFSPADNMKR